MMVQKSRPQDLRTGMAGLEEVSAMGSIQEHNQCVVQFLLKKKKAGAGCILRAVLEDVAHNKPDLMLSREASQIKYLYVVSTTEK